VCTLRNDQNRGRSQTFPVDHDHTTNEVRGILCTNFNLLLGHANDDVSLLEKAIAYSMHYRGDEPPGRIHRGDEPQRAAATKFWAG
jgi:hypothetical protein